MSPIDPIITAAVAFCIECDGDRGDAYFKARDALMEATVTAREALPKSEAETPTKKQRCRGKEPPRFERKKETV